MQTILLIEQSATGRHALKRLLTGNGYRISVAGNYEEALNQLQSHADDTTFDAVVVGYSSHYDNRNHVLFDHLNSGAFSKLPVLILTHEADRKVFEWAARRQQTALLAWDDFTESGDCIKRLLHQEKNLTGIAENSPERDTRILFVDDSRTARAKFQKLLQENGYTVEVAGNCQEAIEKARNEPFDVAIIDYFMPNGNGDQLCRMLREDPRTTDITAAVITGTYMEDIIKATLAAGAVECMFKNEVNELFLARVAAMSRSVQIRNSIEAERYRLEGILSSVGDGVYGVDSTGKVTFMNPMARHILHLSDENQIIGKSAHNLFHYAGQNSRAIPEEDCVLQKTYESGDKIESWQTVFWNSYGKAVPVECTVLPLKIKNRLEGAVVAFRDITDRKRLENELIWQAHHDVLTKLHNRRFFEHHLESEVARLKRHEETSALLYIDLDRFKYINDTAGHAAGDQLLIEVSRQLKARLRESDLLARLGGDEFAIILTDTNQENITIAAESFREVLEQYNFVYEGKHYRIYGSIGVTLINSESKSAGDVLSNADIACHIAKSRGRNQVHVYRHEDDEKVVMSMQLGWSERLHDALENDGFVLMYQPIIPIKNINIGQLPVGDGELWHEFTSAPQMDAAHYEVLVRYVSKSGEIVSPNAFLPTAERFGIMPQIDTWVLTRSIEKLAELHAAGHSVRFTVNISGETLEPERLVPVVTGLIDKHKLDPTSLIIEITESSAIENVDAAKQLINELRMLGCRFALDDFGSGFSSFYHLKHLPVDYVKIDGQFVQGMARDPSDRAIVASINEIAHSFGKRTIAEFVESPEILNMLKNYGVDYAQGYYVASPLRELANLNKIALAK